MRGHHTASANLHKSSLHRQNNLIKRCGIEFVSFMTLMFEEYVRLVLFVERFPVKQCLIEETVYFFGNFCHSYQKTL